jgi:hypothetical protein
VIGGKLIGFAHSFPHKVTLGSLVFTLGFHAGSFKEGVLVGIGRRAAAKKTQCGVRADGVPHACRIGWRLPLATERVSPSIFMAPEPSRMK